MTSPAAERFFELVTGASRGLHDGETLLAHFVGEKTDFVRWNRARVRQAMTVEQGHVALSLVRDGRRETTTLSLAGDRAADAARAERAVAAMRESLPSLPVDPFLLYSDVPSRSERVLRGVLPDPGSVLDTVRAAAAGSDLVGIAASGPMQRGFASSLGHRHFHDVDGFQLDFSLFHRGNTAVNRSYATAHWDAAELERVVAEARRTLEHLTLPEKALLPGTYRVYLAPAAVAEIVQMLNWGGVSEKAQRTKTSCIQRLAEGTVALSPLVTLVENTAEGLAPTFDDVGFVRPAVVPLVTAGRHAGTLAGPRTAKEYGVPVTADGEEGLRAADLAPGELAQADALAALGTGLYVENLWYLGFSDRVNARLTGMTRFATLWVEDGKIVGPVSPLRFDDGLYRLLGEELEALTRERQWILSSQSYGQRSVETTRVPGALVRRMTFTL